MFTSKISDVDKLDTRYWKKKLDARDKRQQRVLDDRLVFTFNNIFHSQVQYLFVSSHYFGIYELKVECPQHTFKCDPSIDWSSNKNKKKFDFLFLFFF